MTTKPTQIGAERSDAQVRSLKALRRTLIIAALCGVVIAQYRTGFPELAGYLAASMAFGGVVGLRTRYGALK
ncbi:MAG: hypothetical protein ACFB2Z_10775 [Maricaulaceae bacterium]